MQGVLKRSKSIIFSAILTHGIGNFSLSILEYCLAEEQFEREDYYINMLRPKYNILQKAGSSLGYKHSEEAREKMRGLRKPSLSIKVEVLDLHTNEKSYYDSISAVSQGLNIHQATITNYFSRNQKSAYKGRYIFKKVES